MNKLIISSAILSMTLSSGAFAQDLFRSGNLESVIREISGLDPQGHRSSR